MNYCKDCKYFLGKRINDINSEGNCECDKFKIGYVDKIEENDEVLVEGDEGWGFVVGEKFSCIHFQSK